MSNVKNIEVLNQTLSVFERDDGKLSKAKRSNAIVYTADQVKALRDNPSGDGVFNLGGRVRVSVINRDSFAAAIELNNDYLYQSGKHKKEALVLNFANPVHPGGGVRRGANAQEEDLCRKSSLLLSLESENARSFYAEHE